MKLNPHIKAGYTPIERNSLAVLELVNQIKHMLLPQIFWSNRGLGSSLVVVTLQRRIRDGVTLP